MSWRDLPQIIWIRAPDFDIESIYFILPEDIRNAKITDSKMQVFTFTTEVKLQQ